MEDFFLSLIRLGIGKSRVARVPKQIDWDQLKDLAAKQGLSAILVDGIERLPEGQRPPKPVLLQWIGETLQRYEYRYELYCRTIAEMAAFYNQHGYKMMLLKGYVCSLDWPKPEHRPCGDIDIWLFGKQKEADAALAAWFKSSRSSKVQGGQEFEIDKSHHHHTVFYWRDFMVENHYDFVNVHQNKTNAEIEKVLKELGKDDSHSFELYGEKVYLPTPNLFALFLIKHTMLHFVLGEFSLRQLLDWAFFVEKHGKEVDWPWLLDILEKYGMMPAFNTFNAICVEDLGFEARLFPCVQFLPAIKDRVLTEIMHPEFDPHDPEGFFAKMICKYRRWKGSEWKYKLCYNESRWSSFWSGVRGHLLKPKSI